MKLTRNFSKWEFECKDGSEMPATVLGNVNKLAHALQVIRDVIQEPIGITSSYRSLEYNRTIGSTDTSQHVLGKAADLQIDGVEPLELYEIIEFLIDLEHIPQGGLGLYNTFVHYDIRGYEARWDNRTK